jgi:hypothetical protein
MADSYNDRASMFRVGDGGFVKHLATGLNGPYDVEEVEGGWLVVCWDSHTVEFVGDGVGGAGGGDRPSLDKPGGGSGKVGGKFNRPTAMVVVPGLGLVVREVYNQRLQVFTTPDAIAMAAMSPHRVAWMAIVARSVLRRGDCGVLLRQGGVVDGECRPPSE